MDLEDIFIKELEIDWDYAKQLNDIHCRLYLEFFVLFLTLCITFSIVIITQNMNIIFWVVSLIFFILSIYYILKIRSLSDELQESRKAIFESLESLKNENSIDTGEDNNE